MSNMTLSAETANPEVIPAKGLKMGPCGEPCEHPCDEPCEDKLSSSASPWKRFLKDSLINTLDLAFDEVYAEPKKILIVGGCRQIDLSQHIALLLPAAEITLVDPDPAEVKRAEEEICCRFKFVASALETLPFEHEQFDLTIAHHFLAYPQDDWQRAMDELGRVTRSNLLLSVHRPVWWTLASFLPGFDAGMKQLGTPKPSFKLPESFDWMSRLCLFAKIKTKLSPLPWMFYMSQIRPRWEEKMVLE